MFHQRTFPVKIVITTDQNVTFLTYYQQILNRLLCNFLIKYKKLRRCSIVLYKNTQVYSGLSHESGIKAFLLYSY